MELFSKVTFYAYWMTSLFSLAIIAQGEILAMGNPSKERDTWMGKCEVDEHEKSQIHKNVLDLQE